MTLAVPEISVAELKKRLARGDVPFLLDVREPEELAGGAIPGSVNVPMGELAGRAGEVPTDRDVVVVCHLGVRSAFAARWLHVQGYDRAVSLAGGMEAWLAG